MSSTMVVKELLDMLNLERLAGVMCDVKRKKMAKALAEVEEDKTEVEIHEFLVRLEDRLMEETQKEMEDVPREVCRLCAQQAIISTLTKDD